MIFSKVSAKAGNRRNPTNMMYKINLSEIQFINGALLKDCKRRDQNEMGLRAAKRQIPDSVLLCTFNILWAYLIETFC